MVATAVICVRFERPEPKYVTIESAPMGITADFVLVVIAGLAGAVCARALGLPLLVGYVAAGVIVGPHTAGPTVVQVHDIELLAEIGVALLLFALGLELSLRELRSVRRVAVVGGPIQVLATAALGVALGRWWGMPTLEAVWFGAMVSLSSTMVVLKMLAAQGITGSAPGRVMLGLLIVQDLAVVPMLIVLPQLGSPDALGPRLLEAVAIAAAFLGFMVVIGTRLLPGVLRWVVRWGSRELFLVAVLAISVGLGALTHRLGLSFALGAFVAGVILSESELSHQALSDVVPLRDVFGLLFFVSVGMLFDPGYVWAHVREVIFIVALIVVGKALLVGGLTRAFGYTHDTPWVVGIGLCQVGEFSFVLARSGLSAGQISKDTYDLALTATVLSMALSPLVFDRAAVLARLWQRRPGHGDALALPEIAGGGRLHQHVVVAGLGRTGRAVVQALQATQVPFVVVELNHAAAVQARDEGLPVIWGDIGSEEVLRAAATAEARLLVAAVPDWHAIRLGIERARRLNPSLFVVARATAPRHVADLRRLRADVAVQPEFEGGVEMVRQVLRQFARDPDEIDRVSSELRSVLYDPAGS